MLRAQRLGNHGAVLFIDLNRFKALNDTHGHHVGDLLLVEVAQRLRQHLRQSDTAARLGGDEFVVLLEGLGADAAQAARHAAAVAAEIRTWSGEYQFGDIRYRGGASVGFTLFPGPRTTRSRSSRRRTGPCTRLNGWPLPVWRPEPLEVAPPARTGPPAVPAILHSSLVKQLPPLPRVTIDCAVGLYGYSVLLDLATPVRDPVIDWFGMVRLTYGFCSPQLARQASRGESTRSWTSTLRSGPHPRSGAGHRTGSRPSTKSP